MDLFLPESGLVIWMTIAFGIVFFILSKFGFPIILKSINEREKYIIKSLDAANEAQQKLLEIEDKGKEIIANAEQQQLLIVKDSQELKKKLSKISFSKPADLEIKDGETKPKNKNRAAEILASK